MKLDIVLPSKRRQFKLENCLNSLFHSCSEVGENEINVHIYLSLNEEYQHFFQSFRNISSVHIYLLEKYRVPDFWSAHLRASQADAMCYINDDILFKEDTLKVILDEFPAKFPDFDGVMGLRQANLPSDQAVEGAFGVIGLRYSERFPERQVFCPDYERFYADFELWKYAKSVDRFYFCQQARIEHLHPSTNRALEDETHKEVRKWLPQDRETFKKRQDNNLLWGNSWELLNKGE